MAWAKGITAIIEDDGRVLGGSIAGVHPETGRLFINKPLAQQMQLNADVMFFIMLHEMGHLALQTDDEAAVDAWAHREYMKRGYSLKQSVFALTRILRFSKPEDIKRANAQLLRAQHFDEYGNID